MDVLSVLVPFSGMYSDCCIRVFCSFYLEHIKEWVSMRWVWLSLTFALIWLVGYLQLTIWVILVLHPLLLWVIACHMKASHSPLPKPAPIKPLLPTESCHWLNNLIKQWLVSSQLLHIMHTMYPEVFRGHLPSRKYFSCLPELILNDK